MGKFTAAFLLVLFIQPVFAVVLQDFGNIGRCYGLGADVQIPSNVNVDASFFCESDVGEVAIGVEAVCASDTGSFAELKQRVSVATNNDSVLCWCRMVYPYVGAYAMRYNYNADASVPVDYRLEFCAQDCWAFCAYWWTGYGCHKDNDIDECLDENMWGSISDTTKREVFLSAMFNTDFSFETPCEIGVSKLMVSTGDSFSLWAEKYTEPSLVVEYNNQKCYGKLESGIGTLNIQFDGAVYHVVN